MKTSPEDITISPQTTIREAMAAIDRGACQIALVVDANGRLTATVTDGDIRRGILQGVDLDQPVEGIMHREPLTVQLNASAEEMRTLMRQTGLRHMPVLDDQGRLVDLAWIGDLTASMAQDTQIVIMAGGLGMRLRPLTETVPKPMLPVGGKPLLELILRNLTDQGFHRFTISLNYLGHVVRDHFGDGARFNAEIDYIEETEKLGTAGALSLMRDRPDRPFLVMNGDLLTSVRFRSLIGFHNETGAVATMCAREFSLEVPYGVIQMDGTRLTGIVEKPTHEHFVNAGIYVLAPEVMDRLEPGKHLNMTDLFAQIMADGQTASVFPISEYWMDIGRAEDLERARLEFDTVFDQP